MTDTRARPAQDATAGSRRTGGTRPDQAHRDAHQAHPEERQAHRKDRPAHQEERQAQRRDRQAHQGERQAQRAEKRAHREERRTERDRRAEAWEQRLALPVILAAVVSVPAVFLTMTGNRALELAGHTLNWASLLVLAGETAVLVLTSGHRLAWIKRHKWTLLVTAVAVPAVILTLAPAQALRLLRLVRLIGTLRVLRAKTIVSAGRILARRFGLTGPGKYALVFGGAVLAAGFVAVVLADPTSVQQHRQVIEEVSTTSWTRVVLVLIAGLILAVATYIVVRHRRRGARTGAAAEEVSG